MKIKKTLFKVTHEGLSFLVNQETKIFQIKQRQRNA